MYKFTLHTPKYKYVLILSTFNPLPNLILSILYPSYDPPSTDLFTK